MPSTPLVLGPGPRLAALEPLVRAAAPPAAPIAVHADPAELLALPGPGGRLVVDADALAPEDVGLVRVGLARGGGWTLVVTGDDEHGRCARALASLPGARWWGWPLDVEQLAALVGPDPAAERAPAPPPPPAVAHEARPVAAPGSAPAFPSLAADLAAIEAILGPGVRLEDLPETAALPEERIAERDDDEDEVPRAVAGLGPIDLTPEELEAFLDTPAPDAPPTPPDRDASREGDDLAPPPWFKDQVADLADRVQRLDLALRALREAAQEADDDDALADATLGVDREAGRLVQFARTLGFLAAPPGPGEQRVALDTLVEELLGGLAGRGPESPRYLFRAAGPLRVRSDKGLLVLALDALLSVASACAGGGEVVRVAVAPEGDDAVAVRLTFPAGPLADLTPAAILAPYGLRRALPGIGPNALAAAARIAQGQGGRLALGPDERPGRLAFVLELPRARAAEPSRHD